jgi:hypothetical protein
MLEAFRNEIIEAEKGRMDLLKWKILLIAGLGAVGLGLSSPEKAANPVISRHLLLCIIPFICVYVDSLCQHLQIRILVISEFFQNYQRRDSDKEMTSFHHYEMFCNEVRPVFYLEDWTQQWATFGCSFVTLLFSLKLLWTGKQMEAVAFALSGILGIALTVKLNHSQKRKYEETKRLAKKLNQTP